MHPAGRWLDAAFGLCLFLLIVAAKWATIEHFGSDIPNWDQWDAEGECLLVPWFEGNRFVEHLFSPHNEHRVVLTKLQSLALVLAAGQWDSRLEMVVNAGLHASVAVVLWMAGSRWMAARWRPACFLVLLALFALPLGWQNTIGGFHSQQYWLLLTSMIVLLVWPFARPWSAAWWAAFVTAALSLLSMASGVLASAVVLVVVGYRIHRGAEPARSAWPTAVYSALVVAVGIVTRVPAEHHASLYAQNVRDFVHSAMHSLQWPVWREFTWPAVFVLWAPWAMITWRVFASRSSSACGRRPPENPAAISGPGRESRAALCLVALGGWVVLQVLATAYARGVGGERPASRYMDTLAFGMAVNALALGWLLSRPTVSRVVTLLRRGIAMAWALVLFWGMADIAQLAWRQELPDTVRYLRAAEALTRAYLMTGDPRPLESDDIPYPSADAFVDRLARPSIVRLMPLSVRPPLRLVPADRNSEFAENHVSYMELQAQYEKAPRAGLSPEIIPLASYRSWGSFAPANRPQALAEWRSKKVEPGQVGGWLKFETAGHLGDPLAGESIALQLRDATTNTLLHDVRPSRIPGNDWRAAYVPSPQRSFVVVARDADPARWVAFSEPVEMSTWSFWAWRATKHGVLLFWISAAAAAALAIGTWFWLKRNGIPATRV